MKPDDNTQILVEDHAGHTYDLTTAIKAVTVNHGTPVGDIVGGRQVERNLLEQNQVQRDEIHRLQQDLIHVGIGLTMLSEQISTLFNAGLLDWEQSQRLQETIIVAKRLKTED